MVAEASRSALPSKTGKSYNNYSNRGTMRNQMKRIAARKNNWQINKTAKRKELKKRTIRREILK